jgi:glutaredoxin 3
MPNVEIYTKMFCGYCRRARNLLKAHGAEFTEIDVSWDPKAEARMIERAGGSYTVPQVFIGGRHIGGSDELALLDDAGQLDALLNEAAPAGDE